MRVCRFGTPSFFDKTKSLHCLIIKGLIKGSATFPICDVWLNSERFCEHSKKFLGKLFQLTRKTFESFWEEIFNKSKSTISL